jgi:hypothetical protein
VNDDWLAAWNIYAVVRVVVAHTAVGEAHHGREKPVYAAAITARTVVSHRTVLSVRLASLPMTIPPPCLPIGPLARF